VTRADAPFSDSACESEWRQPSSRHADDVNAEVRKAVDRGGYAVSDWIVALGNSEIIKRSYAQALFRAGTGRYIARFLLDKS
jgi:hypothetical protein